MKTAILVPAYNEEKNIEITIKQIRKYLPKTKIIVIDDGSTDNTHKIVKSMRVTLLKHKINKGKGEALRTGFNYIKKQKIDFVVVLDADRQLSPKDAVKLLKPLKEGKVDFVMGSRDWNKVPFRHKIANTIWHTTFNIFFRTNLKDTNCGLIALNISTIKALGNLYGGYIIESALLLRAIKNNKKIINIPIQVKYHQISKVPRGIRMFIGIFIFILIEGIKYRLGIK